MSQPASNSPPRNDDESTASEMPSVSSDQAGGLRAVADPHPNPEPDDNLNVETTIRVGSPFAVDPFEHDPARPIEAFYDVGPLKYTAMGAISASIMVIGFGAAAAYYFPIGGAMIAALGCVLSIFGMYSSYRLTAAGLLAVHLCLFVLSYGRSLS